MVFAKFFHAWERRLHAVSKDRVVRPFDWGLDWIETNGHPPGAPPDRILLDWASDAVSDSAPLLRNPRHLRLHVQAGAEAATGALSFPSAMTTPYPENNTVHALYFQSAARRAKDAAPSSCCRSGTPALTAMSACAACSTDLESAPFVSRCRTTMRAGPQSSAAPTTSSAPTSAARRRRAARR